MNKFLLALAIFVLVLVSMGITRRPPAAKDQNWSEYLGGSDRNHYSPLDQVNINNVAQLTKAWEYHTLDSGQIQCNPLVVDGILYGMTATTQPFAIDAATGMEHWRGIHKGGDKSGNSRGLVYWQNGKDKRILYSSGPWLYALDA
ncbi:MAG: pyrroloquinoline quinone-dependent dehydrogenase, partial [Chitinophagaceae bacterium]